MDNKKGKNIYESGLTFIKYVVDTAREPFLILDKDLRVVSANDTFYRFFSVSHKETEGVLVYDIGNGQWNNPQLRRLLETVLPEGTFFKDFEIEHEFPYVGRKVMLLNARRVFDSNQENTYIILAMEDVSRERLLEEGLREYAKILEEKVLARTKDQEGRLVELEKLNKFMVDRELKMVELKIVIETLHATIKTLEERVEKLINEKK